jgi:L-glutamine-phosphate cytidylyltransferase
MNAVIIAAGSGKRISNDVKNCPKSMVRVNGKPIIDYQIVTLKEAGIEEIFVITGPYSEKFNVNHVKYIKDQHFTEHDILGSLMESKKVLKDEILILYSDIIFDLEIIKKILDSKGDISIGIDMNWEKMYEGRTQHPKTEAENVLLEKSTKIIKIKKNIKGDNVGEFIGIIKLSKNGSNIFVKKYDELIKNHSGIFHEAPNFLKGYLTDMIQELVDSKINVEPVLISGKWCEIDTMQDLEKAEKIF